MLEDYIKEQRAKKPILLMTHLVLGYPSFEENLKMISAMAEAGVEMVELQIPFTEPVADGPVIVKANSESLKKGTKVKECLSFVDKVCKEFPEVQFLIMTYYNIIFVKEQEEFLLQIKEAGIKGFIIPDLPPEEAEDWLSDCKRHQLENIFIFTPLNTTERLQFISKVATGFVYCVGRRGVTGQKTAFDASIQEQIIRYQEATNLPLALGFGVQAKEDIDFLISKVDIAVIGSKLIMLQEEQGTKAIKGFLENLRK